MSNPGQIELSARIDRLEKEYNAGIERVYDTLQKIQSALLGKIEENSPGLLEEIRLLKKDREQLLKVVADVAAFQLEMKVIRTEIEALQTKKTKCRIPHNVQKAIWVVTGGAIVVLFLLNNYEKVLAFLKAVSK